MMKHIEKNAESKGRKWIDHSIIKLCPVCNRLTGMLYSEYVPEYNFCPYCGADLREEKENLNTTQNDCNVL